MDDLTTSKAIEIVSLIVGGGVLSYVGTFLISFIKERSSIRLKTAQQPIDQYEALVARIEAYSDARVEKLNGRVEYLEKAHEQCLEQHLECERKQAEQRGEFNGRLDELRRQLDRLAPPAGGVNILMQGSPGTEPTALIEGPNDGR